MRSADEILEDALAHPVEARARIAGPLIESLDEEAVDEQWSAEIARRISEIDTGRVQLVPWSDVRKRLQDL